MLMDPPEPMYLTDGHAPNPVPSGCLIQFVSSRLTVELVWIIHDFGGGKRKGALRD
jgi:hypothetical protein